MLANFLAAGPLPGARQSPVAVDTLCDPERTEREQTRHNRRATPSQLNTTIGLTALVLTFCRQPALPVKRRSRERVTLL